MIGSDRPVMLAHKNQNLFSLSLVLTLNVACQLKPNDSSSTAMTGFPRCQTLQSLDKNLSQTLTRAQISTCSTSRCRLQKVLSHIRSEATREEICPSSQNLSPLKTAVRIALEYSGESMIWASSWPHDQVPSVLEWDSTSQLSDKLVKAAVQKYAPTDQFPNFPYKMMTTDYVTHNLPKDLRVNYARSVDTGSQCFLDHTGDCSIRSFAALSGLSYCDLDFLKFGVNNHAFPAILNQLIDGGKFNRRWLSNDFLAPKRFLELLLRQGGIGSYLVTSVDANAPTMGHTTVMIVERVGDSIRILSQDFQQFTQVEGLPVDFRMRLTYSREFRAQLKNQIPSSTIFFDSLNTLDAQQQTRGIPELNHRYLSFNALKISSLPLGVVNEASLRPYVSQLQLRPKQ